MAIQKSLTPLSYNLIGCPSTIKLKHNSVKARLQYRVLFTEMTTLCGDKSHPLHVNKINDMVTS